MRNKTIQMRLDNSTIQDVENLKKITGISNRTRIVCSAIKVLYVLTNEIKDGNRVLVVDKHGNQKEVYLLL